MKKRFTYTLLFLASCAMTLVAQETEPQLLRSEAVRVGDELMVGLSLDLTPVEVKSGRSLVYTPLVQQGDSLVALPKIVVNGRSRHILYQRLERAEQRPGEVELYRKNGTGQQVDYRASVAYRPWMGKAEVVLVADACGCGWETLRSDSHPLFVYNLEPARPVNPRVVYVTPPAVVKQRSKSGSAYLDFPVNRTEIHPDYRGNRAELAAIDATIRSVEEDRNARITRVTIKGYASPEGSYENNRCLAQGRSEALMAYVKGLHNFGDARFVVDSEPEDWAGLERRIGDSSVEGKEQWLAIIRDTEITDPDRREWKLKQLPAYAEVLRTIYPALRHSDYTVEYEIRNFTTDEAREMLYRDPSQLSLEEMYRVAQTCEPGSTEYNEVFEIAVRLYPDDPVSNLNAANNAIQNRQPDRARRYLAKAADGSEKHLAEAALLMLEEKWGEARQALQALQADRVVGSVATENLRMMEGL